MPKARGLRTGADKIQSGQKANLQKASPATGMILPHAHGFKPAKQPIIRRKPTKLQKKPPINLDPFGLRPELQPSAFDYPEDMQIPTQRPVPQDPLGLLPPELMPFDTVQDFPVELPSSSTSTKRYQFRNQVQYPPPFPMLPYHFPVPVPVPMISLMPPQPAASGQPLATATTEMPKPMTTTVSIPMLSLPTFPTLTMPPAFQNLIATTRKPTKRKKSRNRDSEEDSEDDDSDKDSRKKFRKIYSHNLF